MAATTTRPTPSSTDTRDPELWHVVVDDGEHGLCGLPLGRGESIEYRSASGPRCVVCYDLAERFMDGTWRP